eukprot:11212000-Lingulodinium_polyedra.AAC.1
MRTVPYVGPQPHGPGSILVQGVRQRRFVDAISAAQQKAVNCAVAALDADEQMLTGTARSLATYPHGQA